MSLDLRTITFPKTMPRKSLIEEFLDAGAGLLDELFGQEEQPRTSSVIHASECADPAPASDTKLEGVG